MLDGKELLIVLSRVLYFGGFLPLVVVVVVVVAVVVVVVVVVLTGGLLNVGLDEGGAEVERGSLSSSSVSVFVLFGKNIISKEVRSGFFFPSAATSLSAEE